LGLNRMGMSPQSSNKLLKKQASRQVESMDAPLALGQIRPAQSSFSLAGQSIYAINMTGPLR
jgi:hypothetical protein